MGKFLDYTIKTKVPLTHELLEKLESAEVMLTLLGNTIDIVGPRSLRIFSVDTEIVYFIVLVPSGIPSSGNVFELQIYDESIDVERDNDFIKLLDMVVKIILGRSIHE